MCICKHLEVMTAAERHANNGNGPSGFESSFVGDKTRRLRLPASLIVKLEVTHIYCVRVSDSLPSTSEINTEYNSDTECRPSSSRRARRSVRTHMSHSQGHERESESEGRMLHSRSFYLLSCLLYTMFLKQTGKQTTDVPNYH
jgi:hypothetical protein